MSDTPTETQTEYCVCCDLRCHVVLRVDWWDHPPEATTTIALILKPGLSFWDRLRRALAYVFSRREIILHDVILNGQYRLEKK